MKRNITLVSLIGFVLLSHVALAQNSPIQSSDMAHASNLDELCRDLEKECSKKDYQAATSTLEAIKVLVNNQLQAAQKVKPQTATAFTVLYDNAKYPATLKFGDHTLKVNGSQDIYISGSDPRDATSAAADRNVFIGSNDVTYDGDDLINNAYCKINGQTEEIHYQSSDPKIITISNHEATDQNSGGRLVVHRAGNAVITLTLAGQSLELPIKVTIIPVYTGMLTDNLIKLLGLPDKKTIDIVDWPDTKVIDGVQYNPSASEEKTFVEHWFYDKYPKVAFVVDDFPFLNQIYDTRW